GDILFVGGQNGRRGCQQIPGEAGERLVAGGIGGHAQGARGGLGVFSQFVGVSFQVHGKKVIADTGRTGFRGQGGGEGRAAMPVPPPWGAAARRENQQGGGEKGRRGPPGRAGPVGTIYPQQNPDMRSNFADLMTWRCDTVLSAPPFTRPKGILWVNDRSFFWIFCPCPIFHDDKEHVMAFSFKSRYPKA